MKSILKILSLCLVALTISTNAQDTKKWYADDLYYSASEKELDYIEIVYEDLYYEEDSFDENYQGHMSYSARINRFHRDYYGSSISFNYGYFHTPYTYDYAYGYTPFYYNYWDMGWGWPYNNWYAPYNGCNAWYSPWSPYNYYGWNYGYGYGYGYGYYPYFYGTPFYNESTTVVYGPRNGLGSNTSGSGNVRPSRSNTTNNNTPNSGAVRKPSFADYINPQRPIKRDYSTNSSPTTKSKRNYEVVNTPNRNQTTSKAKSYRNESNSNSNKRSTSYRPSRSTRSNNNSYTPSRSNTNRSSGTNRSSSSPSRRPR